MKHSIKVLFIIFILFSQNVYSRDPLLKKGEFNDLPIDLKADKLFQDNKNNCFIAKGNAELHQGSRTINADYIKYNLNTQIANARGNVILQEGGDKINCDSFEINFTSQVGQVHNAVIFLKEENFHIEGKEIKKISADKYSVKNGTITTCDGPNPLWRIDAKKISLTVEGYAQVKNSFFKIKGVPVMYIPYALFPAKTKRATGFLYPEFGHSSSDGLEFNNSFFWSINENSDATFWLDYASEKGIGNGLEYRIRFKEDSWAKLYGYYINEESDFFEDEYRDKRDRSHERIHLNFEGEHYFSKDLYLKADVNYISDREFYGDYREQVRRSSSAIKKSSLRSKERDESFVFLNKNWESYNLLVNFDVYKNLLHSDPNTLQRLPQVILSGMRKPLNDSSLYYQLDASYDYLWRDSGVKGHRLTIFPKISLPKTFNNWLKFNPEIGMKGISYLNLNHNDDFNKEGIFPSIKAELSTNFIKIFNYDNKKIKKLKHTIEPGILYEYTFENNQDDMPEFDIPDRFYKRHILSYYVKNRFTALYKDETNNLSEKEVGYLLLGQSVNFSDPEGGLYLKGEPEDDYSDIFGEIRISLLTNLYFKSKAAYDHDSNEMRYYNVLLNWNNTKNEYLELEYRYFRNYYEIIDLEGRLKINNSLHVFFDARYDTLDEGELDTEFGIDYASGCWGTKFSIEKSSGSSGRSSDTSVNVYLYLKGLGE